MPDCIKVCQREGCRWDRKCVWQYEPVGQRIGHEFGCATYGKSKPSLGKCFKAYSGRELAFWCAQKTEIVPRWPRLVTPSLFSKDSSTVQSEVNWVFEKKHREECEVQLHIKRPQALSMSSHGQRVDAEKPLQSQYSKSSKISHRSER